MIRLFIQLLLVSMILLSGFQAWGESEPATLAGENQDFPQFTLHGKLVSSTEGLKDCVLLADSSVLENCGHLEILSVKKWDATTFTFVPGTKVPEESEHLYIFVMDEEGKVSSSAGPLEIVDDQPVVDPLENAEDSSTNGDTVKVLKLVQESGVSDKDPMEGPGQPGQPVNSNQQ